MSLARNIGNKYGKKILDNSLSAGKDFAKIAGKNAEATGDLIGNKIADRITKSPRNKEQNEHDRNSRNNYSSRKKRTNN